MALFDSTRWTGLSEAKEKVKESMAKAEVAMLERPVTAPKIKPRRETSTLDDATLEEYRKVAAEVGVSASDLQVEEFRNFLVKKDIPTFNLQEVIKYMDDLTAKDNPTGLGWHWCPVREKDAKVPLTFGRLSVRERDFKTSAFTTTPGSDFYESHRFQEALQAHHWAAQAAFQQARGGLLGSSGSTSQAPHPVDWRTMPSPVYTRTIPLHALKKIAMIEKEYKDKIVFLVTDYTVAPHVIVNPDPFLMAVIPNSAVAHGKGRFVIDVWDEPGFGLDKMLK